MVLPRYLGERDLLWVRDLVDAVVAAVGRPRGEVEERLRALELSGSRRAARTAMTRLVLSRHGFRNATDLDPVAVRRTLFRAAAALGDVRPRQDVFEQCATRLGCSARDLETALYADRSAERLLAPLEEPACPPTLIELYNLGLARAVLRRTEVLQVRAREGSKALLRYARLCRLMVDVIEPADPLDPSFGLEITGPLTLFRFTVKYGHAMACWLPALTRAAGWSLEARAVLRGERVRFRASHGDPIGTTHRLPRRFDSQVEERFFRDLKRLAPSVGVLREADPVRAAGVLLAPDFTLVLPGSGARVAVEILGYWSPAYLERKLRAIAGLPGGVSWVLCADSGLALDDRPAARHRVFEFRRRIDARAFLAFLEVSKQKVK
jgi:predicted nuclease of restriction endonuclease-like RecB superfamily